MSEQAPSYVFSTSCAGCLRSTARGYMLQGVTPLCETCFEVVSRSLRHALLHHGLKGLATEARPDSINLMIDGSGT